MGYKVAIVGANGHVGKAMVNMFYNQADYEIVYYDLNIGTKDEVNSCDLAIVCVPTPKNRDGSCNFSIVEEVIEWIETPLIMIKSTVPIGATVFLRMKYNKRIVMSPEYYGESKYYLPKELGALEWPYLIVGGDKGTCQEVIDVFSPILGPTKSYFITDSNTAELVKYWENIFGALKVTFANEMYEICKALGVCYDEVRELWAQDPRVNRNHTSVFKQKRGFSGKCFPKDLAGLIKSSQFNGYDPKFLKEIQKNNKRFLKMGGKENGDKS